MARNATVAAENVFYQARKKAAEKNSVFSSREGAAAEMHMDRTRLANIELGNIVPNSDDVWAMAKAYDAPELCNLFCSKYCRIGEGVVPELNISDFDRITLQVLGSCESIEALRSKLISIAADGKVADEEENDFAFVLDILNKISVGAQTLELWAKKNRN